MKSLIASALLLAFFISTPALALAKESMGEAHKSAVATAVAELLDAADRAGGIGIQVRELAKEQETLHNEISEKMDKVGARSWVQAFLFGSDYETLGELRSTIVTSENGISVLEKARDKALASAKADIDLQIEALEHENAHAREFIAEQEGKFSLFGWLVRLF